MNINISLFSFLLFFFVCIFAPSYVFSYVVSQGFEPYCDDQGCYDVQCTEPFIEYVDGVGNQIRFQDIGPDFDAVQCVPTALGWSLGTWDSLTLSRGYYYEPPGYAGFSSQYVNCGSQVMTYQTACGTQAQLWSMANSGPPVPVDPLAVTWKPGMWTANYWINSLLSCGPVYTILTADDPGNPDDVFTCDPSTQAAAFWFDLTTSIPYGTGFKCSYSYNNGNPYTSDNMTPCGYCFNTCNSDIEHLDPVTCQCSFPSCPPGQKWSEAAGSCVVDPCPPPLFDTGGGVCDINCPQVKQGLSCLTCAQADPAFPLWDPVSQICVPDVASCTDLLGQAWMFDYNGVCAQCNDIQRNNDIRPPDSYTAFDAYPVVTIDLLYDGIPRSYDTVKYTNQAYTWPLYGAYPAGLYSRDYTKQIVNCPDRPPDGPYIYTPESISIFYDYPLFDGTHGRFLNVPLSSGVHSYGASISFTDSPTLPDITRYLYLYGSNECETFTWELGYIEPVTVSDSIFFTTLPDYFEVCLYAGVYHPACNVDVKTLMTCVSYGSVKGQGFGGGGNFGGGIKQKVQKQNTRGAYEKKTVY